MPSQPACRQLYGIHRHAWLSGAPRCRACGGRLARRSANWREKYHVPCTRANWHTAIRELANRDRVHITCPRSGARALQDPVRVGSVRFVPLRLARARVPPGRQLAAPSPQRAPPPARESAARAGGPGHRQASSRGRSAAGPPALAPRHHVRAPYARRHPAPLRLSGRLPDQWTGPVRLYTYSPTPPGRPAAVQASRRGKSAGRDAVYYGGAPCTARFPIQSGPLF
jgi:hypothetical protein